MKTDIEKILEKYNVVADSDYEVISQEIVNLLSISEPKSEPIETLTLIGHLNKSFGYNGIKEIEVGTEVFEFKDRYCFEMIPLSGNIPIIQKFYKETLLPCINFIKT